MDITKMSSRGQVVIPQNIREQLHVSEGTVFTIIGSNDTIILKKLPTPSKEELFKELTKIAKEGKKRLQAKGFTEADLRAK